MMRRRSSEHVPGLNAEGVSDKLMMELMAEGKSLRDIAEKFVERTEAGTSWEEALARAGDLSLRYGR
jgi:hypothetical protein